MTPIFMIGTQRSGSNLLRLMMNQLTEIASPHPPHILERMFPLMDNYKDLSSDSNFSLLVDDVCRLVESNPVEWMDTKLDRNDLIKRCTNHSLIAVYKAIYDTYAEINNADTWCCKSLANIKYVNDIENYFKEPKYIYLYRDGRDVALSFKKAVVGEKHIYNIAKDWTKTQEIALELKSHIKADRFFSISYEQLTSDTESSIRSLCNFLGVEFNPSMLEFHKTTEAKNAADSSNLWKNVTQPVISNNSKKYLTEMSTDDLKIFESVSGRILDQLGYEREHIKKGKELVYDNKQIQQFNSENDRLKTEALDKIVKEDMERRKKQTAVLDEIKARKVA